MYTHLPRRGWPYYALLLFVLLPGLIRAQVSAYTFAASSGTYTPLSGGNILSAAASDPDDGFANNIAIGFNFVFDGTTYAYFSAGNNGLIKLGTSSLNSALDANAYTNSFPSATYAPLIAPLWDDNYISASGADIGDIQYQLGGIAPNRVLTVQWSNSYWGSGSPSSGPYNNNFQLKLYESTNTVKIVYGTMTGGASSASATIGINGVSSYLSVTPAATATASGSNSNNNIIAATYLTTGTTYTFTPPAPITIGTIAAIQQSGNITAGSSNNNLLRIDIPAAGAPGTLQLNSITFNYTGTNATDIPAGGVKLWSGTSTAPVTQIGTSQSISAGTVIFSGLTTNIPSGTTYLWLTVNAATTVTLGDLVDATVPIGGMSITAGGGAVATGTQPASLLDPIGARTIGHCTPASTCGNEYIKSITLNGYTSTTSACSAGGYADNTGLGSVTLLTQSTTYPLSVLAHINDVNSQVGVWIDFNQNGSFESSEFTLLGTQTGTNVDKTYTANITVPAGALTGTARMRVRSSNGGGVSNSSACTTNNIYGEFEDYSITIAAATSCSGTPPTAVASSSATSVCSGNSFTLNASNLPANGNSISYQWQSSPANAGTFSNITGATTSTYVVSSQPSSTDYRLIVTCSAGPASSTSNIISVAQSSFLNCYCTPTYSSGCSGDNIASVVLGTLSIPALTCSPNINDITALQPATSPIPDLNQGVTSNLTITFGNDNLQYHGVWVDFNHNGTFETSEYFSTLANAGADGTVTLPIAVPLAALTGNTRLRIRGGDDSQPSSSQACGTAVSNYGSAIDMLVNILPNTPCTGTPSAGTATGATTICSGNATTLSISGYSMGVTGISIQWQSSATAGGPYMNVTGGTGAITSSYTTPALTTPMYYIAQLTCAGSGLTALSNEIAIGVSDPQISGTSPGSRCGSGTVSLGATASSGTVRWFSAATGGVPLATGNTFITPAISTTTNFYAEAFDPAATANIGLATENSFVTQSNSGMYISATTSSVINAVDVYPNTAGTLNIILKNNSGTTMASRSFTITPADVSTTVKKTLTLNFAVPAGSSGWQLVYDLSLNTGSGSYTYPYSSNGFSITGNNITGNNITSSPRYFLYNWNVSTSACVSPRTGIAASITASPVVILTASNASLCPGSSDTLTASSSNAGYTYTFNPGNLTGATQIVSPAATTLYTVQAVDNSGGINNGCNTTTSTTITLSPNPPALTITPAIGSIDCGDAAILLTASPAPLLNELCNSLPASFSTSSVSGTPSATLNSTYYAEGSGSVLFTTASTYADIAYAMNNDVSLANVGTATLTFSHIVAMEDNNTPYDFGYVQYSTDGGSIWTSFPQSSYTGSGVLFNGVVSFSTKSYGTWMVNFTSDAATPGAGPATSLWRAETINIPAAAIGSTQFRVRFRYTTDNSNNYYGWLLDNIRINNTTPATVNWGAVSGLYTDAAATIPYSGNASNTVYLHASTSGIYAVTAISGNCSATTNLPVTVNNNATALADSSGSGNTYNYIQGASTTVYNQDCELIARIDQRLPTPVSGLVSTKEYIDGSMQLFNNMPLLTRHYEITPFINVAGASATITLYATQAEFDEYNNYVTSNNLSLALMPTNGIDNGKVRIHKESGTSTAGLAGTYTPGTQTDIIPTVSWNAAKNWWELLFSTNGFSGFFITTGSGAPLPLVITNITAQNEGKANRIDWHVATEHLITGYEVQRLDAGKWISIGRIVAGSAGGDYRFYDQSPLRGKNDYRLKIEDLSGRVSYSTVVMAIYQLNGSFEINVYPNPVTSTLSIRVAGAANQNALITLSDAMGRMVAQARPDGGVATIDMEGFAKGIYILRYSDAQNDKVIKVQKR